MIYLDRELSGPLELVDDGTLLGRIVPWDVDAEVFDRAADGTVDHYLEAWAPGAFADQARSTNRGTVGKVELVETHTGGLGKVGYALELPERADGQYGLFRVMPRHRDDVAQIVADGFDGLSVRFHPKRGGVRLASMVGALQRRVRTAAHMVHVAMVPEPTWSASRVLAMREPDGDAAVDAADIAAAAADRARQQTARDTLDQLDTVADRWAHLL